MATYRQSRTTNMKEFILRGGLLSKIHAQRNMIDFAIPPIMITVYRKQFINASEVEAALIYYSDNARTG
jgi:hypothetical protein